MVLIWGSSLYGKVDEVPGLGYVATQFGHLYYLPLIPMGSYIVLNEENGLGGSEWQGTSIGLNGKSILIGYLRAALVLALIVAGFAVFLSSAKVTAAIVAGLAGLLAFGTYMIPGVATADHPTARRMAKQLGMTEEGRILIDLQYGQVHPDRAEARLVELAAQRDQEQAAQRARLEAKKEERRAKRANQKAERASKENADLKAKAPRRRRRLVER